MTVSGMAFAVTWPAAMEAGLARDGALALAPTMLCQASIADLTVPVGRRRTA